MTNPTAIICLTGSELTRGETRDSNGSWLAGELSWRGFRVRELRLLPDDYPALVAAFREVAERADLILASGGLGPTADDVTVEALSEALGPRVVRDAGVRERLERLAERRWGSVEAAPANFFRQADVLEGSRVLPNPVGLAPCFVVPTRRGLLAALPGVPSELEALFRDELAPVIEAHFEPPGIRFLRTQVLGLPESGVEERVARLELDPRLEYGISARPGEITLKLLASHPDHHHLIDHARGRLEAEFGVDLVILGEAPRPPGAATFAAVAHELLIAAGKTLVTAESCTGGLVAKLLTDLPGCSAYFLGSVVAYDNRVKASALGVSEELLETHGAVCEPVARAMAAGARERLGADFALSITGVAGPSGGTPEKPVGLVHFGLAGPNGEPSTVEHRLRGSRAAIRQRAAIIALDLLRRAL